MISNLIEGVESALRSVPAEDRDTWLRTAMAVKSALGEAGRDIWDSWSQQSESYNAADARDVWKSVKADGKVTAGTLFYEADIHGWKYARPDLIMTPEERAEQRHMAAERTAKENAERAKKRAAAAKIAAAVWKAATLASPNHLYLSRKGVKPVSTLQELPLEQLAAILGYALKTGGEPLVTVKRQREGGLNRCHAGRTGWKTQSGRTADR